MGHGDRRAVPTIDLPADELAAVTAAIRGVIQIRARCGGRRALEQMAAVGDC
jgi:hypothetical protein